MEIKHNNLKGFDNLVCLFLKYLCSTSVQPHKIKNNFSNGQSNQNFSNGRLSASRCERTRFKCEDYRLEKLCRNLKAT